MSDGLLCPLQKRTHLVIGENVCKRTHADGMRHLFKLGERFTADTPRRRIFGNKLRIFFFKLGKLAEHHIIFIIGNYRRVVNIIQFGIVFYLVCEIFHSRLCRISFVHKIFPPFFQRHIFTFLSISQNFPV